MATTTQSQSTVRDEAVTLPQCVETASYIKFHTVLNQTNHENADSPPQTTTGNHVK